MNEDEYINSGILQQYSLGLLTAEEEKKVEAICLSYPKIAKELVLLRAAIRRYPGYQKRRRERLRSAIWEAIKKLWNWNPNWLGNLALDDAMLQPQAF